MINNDNNIICFSRYTTDESVEFEITIHTFRGEVWFFNPNSTIAQLECNLDLKTTLHREEYGWSSQIPHFYQWCIWLTPRHSWNLDLKTTLHL